MAQPTIRTLVSASPRPLRAIIIDDSREYMVMLRRMLAETLPDIEVTEYDPDQQGKPGPNFDWSAYDVLLLDHNLGGHENGLDWLVEFQAAGPLPPTILMTAQGNDYLAARAIKLGAADYVRKQDVTTWRIGRMVRELVVDDAVTAEIDCDQTLCEERARPPHLDILEELIARHPPRPSGPGASIGYRFVRLIGQGASSRVYLAERTSDDNTLVLKVIDLAHVRDVHIVERFIREAEIVAAISSPYVVRFYDFGLTPSYGFIAMEFFTRGDLKQRIERGITRDDAVNYVRHIALGLQAIHARGIVHRDLKPGNIMFRADDSLALADFGIARRLDEASDLTNAGSVLGTPNYLSPEQALGQVVDHRADLYAVGVMLYEMLTGRKPFRAESASALVFQHVHAERPILPAEFGDLQPLLDRLLAVDPAARFASAGELVSALERSVACHAA
ncbi:MAG: protein kinase [Gammaproteobacteria bacterium]|nr:protein kinase [Gammaproteobacteria bacterium]